MCARGRYPDPAQDPARPNFAQARRASGMPAPRPGAPCRLFQPDAAQGLRRVEPDRPAVAQIIHDIEAALPALQL